MKHYLPVSPIIQESYISFFTKLLQFFNPYILFWLLISVAFERLQYVDSTNNLIHLLQDFGIFYIARFFIYISLIGYGLRYLTTDKKPDTWYLIPLFDKRDFRYLLLMLGLSLLTAIAFYSFIFTPFFFIVLMDIPLGENSFILFGYVLFSIIGVLMFLSMTARWLLSPICIVADGKLNTFKQLIKNSSSVLKGNAFRVIWIIFSATFWLILLNFLLPIPDIAQAAEYKLAIAVVWRVVFFATLLALFSSAASEIYDDCRQQLLLRLAEDDEFAQIDKIS